MKRIFPFLLAMLFLCACGSAETFEVVEDDMVQNVMAPMGALSFSVPMEAVGEVFQDENGDRLYLCDGFTLSIQTRCAGDTDSTIREVCGYDRENLSVMTTRQGEHKRHEWVWSAAGETGDQLGRAVLIDDGHYHYCLSVMADTDDSGALLSQWQSLFSSVAVTN